MTRGTLQPPQAHLPVLSFGEKDAFPSLQQTSAAVSIWKGQ